VSILRIVRTYKSLQRLRHIIQILTKHGLGGYIDRLNLAGYLPVTIPFGRTSGPREAATPKRVVKLFEELGPTTIKLGQMLEEYQRELSLLHDRVEPFLADEAKRIIQLELKRPVEELFAKFNDVPIGSASIAQVHEAVLLDGTEVMVKVRRPGIEETVRADIDLLRALADLVKKYIPEAKALRPRLLVEELARGIRRELDFVSEAAYTSRFHEEFLNDDRILTPNVYWDFTSSAVLTVERLCGTKITDSNGLRNAGIDEKALAANLSSVFMKQYFETGVFHGDPHPGNIFVTDAGKICLIDFGLVGHMSRDLREQLVTALIALDRGDFDTIVDVYTEMGVTSVDTDLSSFKRDLTELADRYYGIPIKRIDLKRLFSDLTYTARENNILLPRDIILLGKSMAMISGIARDLDGEVNIAAKADSYAKKLIAERLEPSNIVNKTVTGLWRTMRFLNALPREIGQIVRKLRSGSLEMAFRHEGLEGPVAELDKASNRLALSIILASVVVASSLIMNAKLAPIIPNTDISVIGLAGYFFAAVLGVWLVVGILRSGRI
jgi:ubiquinone biosynthesis protein